MCIRDRHKSEDPNDSLSFVGQEMIIPTYTEVTKRDSIVNYDGSRYRAYVYINPSKMRVIKTIYTEDGISTVSYTHLRLKSSTCG